MIYAHGVSLYIKLSVVSCVYHTYTAPLSLTLRHDLNAGQDRMGEEE